MNGDRLNLNNTNMKTQTEILEGKRLTKHQKNVLGLISGENCYILEIFDINEVKTSYIITNGEDDIEDVRELTMKKLKSFDFMRSQILPSSDRIIRTKHFIPEELKVKVYLALC